MEYQKFVNVFELRQTMHYPVGNFIEKNIPLIKAMGQYIQQEFPGPIRLICAGSSGSIISAVLATMLPVVEILYISKRNENRHGDDFSQNAEVNEDTVYNVIVDDFIFSGSTIRRIYETAINFSNINKIHGLAVSASVDVYCLRDIKIDTVIAGSIN